MAQEVFLKYICRKPGILTPRMLKNSVNIHAIGKKLVSSPLRPLLELERTRRRRNWSSLLTETELCQRTSMHSGGNFPCTPLLHGLPCKSENIDNLLECRSTVKSSSQTIRWVACENYFLKKSRVPATSFIRYRILRSLCNESRCAVFPDFCYEAARLAFYHLL